MSGEIKRFEVKSLSEPGLTASSETREEAFIQVGRMLAERAGPVEITDRFESALGAPRAWRVDATHRVDVLDLQGSWRPLTDRDLERMREDSDAPCERLGVDVDEDSRGDPPAPPPPPPDPEPVYHAVEHIVGDQVARAEVQDLRKGLADVLAWSRRWRDRADLRIGEAELRANEQLGVIGRLEERVNHLEDELALSKRSVEAVRKSLADFLKLAHGAAEKIVNGQGGG